MINFEKEADYLMAASMEHTPGTVGMDYLEWRDIYGDLPSTDVVRKAIAEQLKGFARRVIDDANERMAKAQMEQIQKDLEAMKKK